MMGWTKFEENQGKRVGETEMITNAWVKQRLQEGSGERWGWRLPINNVKEFI